MSDTSTRYRHTAHAEPKNAAEVARTAEPLAPVTVTARSARDVTPPNYGAKP